MAYLSLSPVSVAIYTALNVAGLTALVSTRIYEVVPQAPTYPFVLYEVQERDERGMGSGYGLPEVELMVHALSQEETYAQAQTIIAKVIELLRDQTLTVSGYNMCGKVFYDRTERMPDADVNGVSVRELVAMFRVFVEEA